MKVLAGFSVDDMRSLVGDAMEPVLRPLVYDEPLHLVRRHRERGEKVFIVSATLQEIVEHIADDLGFDGAIGSTCEIVDGVYTGRSLRATHGEGKAQAVRELAAVEGLDLAACTAYSDSYTDVPFLEVVGHPVAANPDRRLRRIARDRGWPVMRLCSLRRHGRAWRRSAFAPRTSRRWPRTSSTPRRTARRVTASRASSGSSRGSSSTRRRGRSASSPSRSTSAGTARARSAT